eukprot:TRINITY_DN7418_c1_g1_i1.p1 TRINITY_DN7418_c1_g1~~TRINITY_DN7418_c1_g1_i1.p1  ORF type:complete len:606 (+),score=76.31 TRINITY_DN7418_c1_g1_i1:142-1959(+)
MQRARLVRHGTDDSGAGRRRATQEPECERSPYSSERSMHRSRAPFHRGDTHDQSTGYSEDDSTRASRRRHSWQHSSEHSMRRSRAPFHRGDSRDDFDGYSEDDSTRMPRQEHGWHASERGTHRSRVPVHRGDARDDIDDYYEDYEDDASQVPRRKQYRHSSENSTHRSRAPLHRGNSRDHIDGYSEDYFEDAPRNASKSARGRRADEAQYLDAAVDCSRRRDKRNYFYERRSSRSSYCREANGTEEEDEELQAQDERRRARRVAKDPTPTDDREWETAGSTKRSEETPLAHHVQRKKRRHVISPTAVEDVGRNDTPLDDLLEGLDKALKHAEDVCAGKGDQAKRYGDPSIERPRRRRRTAQTDAAKVGKTGPISRSSSPSMRADAPPSPKPLTPAVKPEVKPEEKPEAKEEMALEVATKAVNTFKKLDLEALQQEKQKLLSAMSVRKQPLNERRNGFSSSLEETQGSSTEKPRNPLSGMTGAAMARLRLINRPAAVPASRVAGISPLGYPMRPGIPICTLYSQTGSCWKGNDCRYDHPTPATPALNKEGGALALLTYAPRSYDSKTEVMLDEWVKCKRMRNFTGADAIRAALRNQGVDPDVARPG